MNLPSERYIERHSRQLVLPNWSLELQEKISRITISTPAHPILISYLIGLGFENFHIQTENHNLDLSTIVPNWEEYILVTYANIAVDISIEMDSESERTVRPLVATIKLIPGEDSYTLEAYDPNGAKALSKDYDYFDVKDRLFLESCSITAFLSSYLLTIEV